NKWAADGNLIPELELIIGKQPPVPDLPLEDAQNRFQLVFVRLLGVFARAEHPLALFLDDLQWLDAATLQLLEHLMTEPDVQHLLLLGAYRGLRPPWLVLGTAFRRLPGPIPLRQARSRPGGEARTGAFQGARHLSVTGRHCPIELSISEMP